MYVKFYEMYVTNTCIQRRITCTAIFGFLIQTAIEHFRRTEIYLFNRDIFPDHLFAPSKTTNRFHNELPMQL